ncbi:unnamed protein product [Rotaria sp. Silwood2]|nr:unnamed protein product [Rotaria sp. Silwood2]
MYSQFIGPLDTAIKAVCKNYTYSEFYEIAALCNVLRCNIRSIYPKIDFREDMEILNTIFRPTSPIIASCSINIFWSHVLNEIDVRTQNNMTWIPNHFVPLMSPSAYDDSDNISHQSVLKIVTPEKRTSKNNASIQIRIPEFQSSPSRRRRSERSNETGFAQSAATDAIREAQNGIHEQRQSAIEQQINPNQENLYGNCFQPLGFYCYSSSCVQTDSKPDETVPGLKLGCQLFNYFISTLQCFFSQLCVQILIDKRLYGFENYYLPIDLTDLTALDPGDMVTFKPEDFLEDLILASFIDQWIQMADYESYYAQCQSEMCIYTVDQKLHLITLVNSVIELLGGFCVVLGILAPLSIEIIQGIYRLCDYRTRGKKLYASDIQVF